MTAQPRPIGADAVLPARRTPLRRVGAALRLARATASGRLQAGRGVWLARGVRIEIAPGGHLSLGDGAEIGERAHLEVHGRLEIGDEARIGDRATIRAHERVEIGPGATIGEWALVSDADDPTGGGESRVAGGRESGVMGGRESRGGVVVGPGARVGAHAAVVAGARVGAGAAVGSYALVRGAVEAGASVTSAV